MFDRLPSASDARNLILSEIEERRVQRRSNLLERLSSELRTKINQRKFDHNFYSSTHLWDDSEQAEAELDEIAKALEKLGYSVVVKVGSSGSPHGRSANPHALQINW